MIKIIHVITGLIGAGAEKTLHKLVSHLDRSIFQNIVVSLQDLGVMGSRIRSLGIPVVALGMQPNRPNPLPFLRLLSLLRQERPKILQTWLYHADLLGLLAGQMAHIPTIVWNLRCSEMREKDCSRSLSLIVWMLAKFSRWPQAIVTNSLSGRLDHERLGYHPKRWAIIPNGFDVDVFLPYPGSPKDLRRNLGLPVEVPLIGLVARFHPMKDHANFISAAGHLLRLRREADFVLVGEGVDNENSSLVSQIRATGQGDNFHLLGEFDDIVPITQALDIATSSSAYGEGFSNAIGEAMACGVPCVVTNVGDSAYLVAETGEVVAPRSPLALAAAWDKILSLPDSHRRNLGLAARQRIISNFSLTEIVKQYERFYLGMIERA